MIRAIVDTNVLLQSVISSAPAAAARVLDACYERRFRLVYSPATLDELLDVMAVDHIRQRHGYSDDEVLEFAASLLAHAERYPGEASVPHTITRDVTDTKFLVLAAESKADYLVTKDGRHLLRLKKFGRTQIITPTKFLRQLPPASRGRSFH